MIVRGTSIKASDGTIVMRADMGVEGLGQKRSTLGSSAAGDNNPLLMLLCIFRLMTIHHVKIENASFLFMSVQTILSSILWLSIAMRGDHF